MKTVNNRDISHKCLLCGFDVKLIYPEEAKEPDFNPPAAMWHDGIVDKISAGYGSKVDGDMFLIAICDTCVKSRPETIKYVGSYM